MKNKILIIMLLVININIFCDESIIEAPAFINNEDRSIINSKDFENSNIETFPMLSMDDDKQKKEVKPTFQIKQVVKDNPAINQVLTAQHPIKEEKLKINFCQPYCYDISSTGDIQAPYPSHFPFEVESKEKCNAREAAGHNVCPKQHSYIHPDRFEFKEDMENEYLLSIKNLDVQFKSVYFLPWSSKIKNPEVLEQNAVKALKILNIHPTFKVLVVGVVPRVNNLHKYVDSYILSLRRANVVKAYLIGQGIPAERIISSGIGFQKTQSTPEEGVDAQDKDRRADMYVSI